MRRGHEDYLTQALEEDQENRDPNSISVRGSGGGVGIGEDMSTMEQVGPFWFNIFCIPHGKPRNAHKRLLFLLGTFNFIKLLANITIALRFFWHFPIVLFSWRYSIFAFDFLNLFFYFWNSGLIFCYISSFSCASFTNFSVGLYCWMLFSTLSVKGQKSLVIWWVKGNLMLFKP